MNIPVLLILYKRPDTTTYVINSLKNVKAKLIYIVINKPPSNQNYQDYNNYKKVLKLVNEIDWGCKLVIKKRKKHFSSYDSVKSSVEWFFKNEKEGIVLEDDTVPNKSFFIICKKLLKKYRNNKRIAQISGTSFKNLSKIINHSYFFSNYAPTWGYATWRRSINDYDEKMKDWPKLRKKKSLLKINNSEGFLYYWTKIFDNQYKNRSKHWDERWLYSNWKNNKLSIIPKKNLVKNIGFGATATHTKTEEWFSNLETHEIKYKNKHPKKIFANLEYDNWLTINVFGINFIYNFSHKLIQNRIIKNKIVLSILKKVYEIIRPIFRFRDFTN
tara:strand:- start:87 stop:1073 length:987 start_codon:yes stop_codon:yes gene_type:complete